MAEDEQMVDIPGTNYQISSGRILGPDGAEISQQDFLAKVALREISLTENSLQVIESHLGPDLSRSAALSAGLPVPVGDVADKLGTTSAEQAATDIYSLMAIMQELSKDMRKGMQEVRDAEFANQVQEMTTAADDRYEAAKWQLAADIIGGAGRIGSGASLSGSAVAGASAADLQAGKGKAEMIGGGSGMVSSILGFVGAGYKHDAEIADIHAKEWDHRMGQSKDTLDGIRDMMAKVRETLSAIVSAESDVNRTIARM